MTTHTASILIVDDETSIREILQDILEDEGYQVHTAANGEQARGQFNAERYDLIFLDIWMQDVDGISLLKEWQDAGCHTPIIMISGHGTVETAVEAIRIGAYDYLEKPLTTAKLLVTATRALESRAKSHEIDLLRSQLEPIKSVIGNSPKMIQLRQQIERIAATQSWVLISGQQGSGKGVVARALHAASDRGDQPFVEVNLAAIPAENMAKRLFGSEQDGEIYPGCFEQAGAGSLFLDEIGDLDTDTQIKLLSTLQAGRFQRVGGNVSLPLKARIFSSSNQNLTQLIADKQFREDLYYRLNVVPLHMPPLSEHLDDITALANFYIDFFVSNEQLPYRELSTSAVNRLRQHSWPGNVREFKNLLQRLLVSGGSVRIHADEVELALKLPASQAQDSDSAQTMPFNTDLRTARDHFETAYLEYHLQAVNGNVSMLAEVAGVERTHLYRKLKALSINPKDWK